MEKKMLKWAQLDLARQAESTEFIHEFIDFLADNGYNGLFLYLEWRIGTASFAGPVSRETYSPEEMRSLVAYARTRGLDVIPGLAVLGHMELFLERPENKEFAELKDHKEGRFSSQCDVVCPTHPRIRRVLGDYLCEIADIFPSQYLHIGGDEVWDMACCVRCREKAPDYAAEGRLYGEHLAWCAQFVIDELHRTPVMWDDMWEYYPEALELMPRQTVMADWQYQLDMHGQRGHFFNRVHNNWLERYDRLGFSYLAAPADFSTSNIRTCCEYVGQGQNCLGMLVTSWEKATLFMYRALPRFAYAGAFSEHGAQTFAFVAHQLFGIDDPVFVRALALYAEGHGPRTYYGTEGYFLCDNEFGLSFGEEAARGLCRAVFEKARKEVHGELPKRILDDILLQYRTHQAFFRAHRYIQSLCRGPQMCEREGDETFTELVSIRDAALDLWKKFRGSLDDKHMRDCYQRTIDAFEKLRKELVSRDVMCVRLMLPEKYSAYWLKLIVHTADGASVVVADGVFKPAGNTEEAFFDRYFAVPEKITEPVSIELRGHGYGGIGVAYAELRLHDGARFTPGGIARGFGELETPHYALDNDCKWAFLGSRDTGNNFRDRHTAQAVSGMELLLKKEC